MNTPAHAIANLLLFGKTKRERYPAAIILGALIPDTPMLLFYIWSRLLGHTEKHIWQQGYFDPAWQSLFDAFHSFPLLAAAWLICWHLKYTWMRIFFASMFLHACFDFPLHHNDAHHHFFPFSDWRFLSPISYWNPEYYGNIMAPIEVLMVVLGSLWLLKTTAQVWIKRSVLSIIALYLAFIGFVMLVWA